MKEYNITELKLIEILDSRGNPTVLCKIILNNISKGLGFVPSGASTGQHEAVELRDLSEKRYLGKGIKNIIGRFNELFLPKILNRRFRSQQELDLFLIDLDGSENKSNIGANIILSISFAFANAKYPINSKDFLFQDLSLSENLSNQDSFIKFPTPMLNIINGGVHANNNLDIQEFMIMPVGADTFSESIRIAVEVFQTLKKILLQKKLSVNVGDEGGFAPNISSTEDAIELILESVHEAGYIAGKDILISLDVAASELYDSDKKYYYFHKINKIYSSEELIDFYSNLIKKYPIFSIEDPISEQDIAGFRKISRSLSDKVQIVGDDLFVTNVKKIKQYSSEKICNAVLIKPNQIGTLTETIEAIKLTHDIGYESIISHRSGETEDAFISEIAIATQSKQIKFGSCCRSDRVSKYNKLIEIEMDTKEVKKEFSGIEIYNKFLNFKSKIS